MLFIYSFDEDILHICGSLIPENTGNVKWLETDPEESQAYRFANFEVSSHLFHSITLSLMHFPDTPALRKRGLATKGLLNCSSLIT